MDGDAVEKNTEMLETGVERSQDESNSTNQIHDSDATLQTSNSDSGSRGEGKNGNTLLDATRIDLNGSPNAQSDSQSMDSESDVFSTPIANLRQTNLLQSSAVVEVSSLKDLSISPSPRVRKC